MSGCVPCPVDGCDAMLEASTKVYIDIDAVNFDGERCVIEAMSFSTLNDHYEGVPLNVESEFTLSCTEGHHVDDWSLGDGVRASLGAQPIGCAPRTLGTRGGM